MLTRQDLLDSMLHECRVAQHLFRKLPAGSLGYRPTRSQRSTLELLRYLSFVGVAIADYVLNGDPKGYQARVKRAAAMPGRAFPRAMSRQMRELKTLLAGIPEKDFRTRRVTLPWGRKGRLGSMLVETSLKWLVGYRMQLFLYAKARGASKLGTPDCWLGTSRRPPLGRAGRG